MREQELIELVKKCKKQDQKAQLVIYNLFFKAMFNTAYRIVQDKMLAQDIMQEAFLTVFSKIKDLKEEVTFPKWLKQVTVNKSLNHLKKEKRFVCSEHILIKEEIEEQVWFEEENEDLNNIMSAIKELKENYRVLLTLYYLEGYDYEEIVEITGFTYVNCRSILLRAKQSLRKKLRPCLRMIL